MAAVAVAVALVDVAALRNHIAGLLPRAHQRVNLDKRVEEKGHNDIVDHQHDKEVVDEEEGPRRLGRHGHVALHNQVPVVDHHEVKERVVAVGEGYDMARVTMFARR